MIKEKSKSNGGKKWSSFYISDTIVIENEESWKQLKGY